MNKEDIIKTLNELKAQPKKKFTQSYDLIINLKNIVVKSAPVDFYVTLHYPKGKLIESTKQFCDLVITEKDFPK